jgi:hypothetical protein
MYACQYFKKWGGRDRGKEKEMGEGIGIEKGWEREWDGNKRGEGEGKW